MDSYRILELFSGIGGMHCAWRETGLEGCIIAAVDINTLANKVYSHNFEETTILNRNIQSLTAKFINSINPNVILMSPPCQPFTRNGLKKDSEDIRSYPFSHLLSILKDLTSIKYILMENVKGFEESKMRDIFVNTLTECNFSYQEFLLTPTQFGVPNSRLRYYCLARMKGFNHSEKHQVITSVPNIKKKEAFQIANILEEDRGEITTYYLSEKLLKKASILDICHSDSTKSCCFTKAYTHFLEGTGSVYTHASREDVRDVFEKCKNLNTDGTEYNKEIQKLKLRFFTPKEVSRLMAFPDLFEFPEDVTNKQCYRLLGNSINITVVSELIKFLITS